VPVEADERLEQVVLVLHPLPALLPLLLDEGVRVR